MILTAQQRAACPIPRNHEGRLDRALQSRYDAWIATLGPVGCQAQFVQFVQPVACDKTPAQVPPAAPESISVGGGATLPLPAQRRA